MRPERVQLRRVKGWRKPEGAVVVARPSRWGNCYKVRRSQVPVPPKGSGAYRCTGPEWVVVGLDKWGHETGSSWAGFADEHEATVFAVDLFRRALLAAWCDLDGELRRDRYLGMVRGKDLACWCPLDAPCHADVLLEFANTPLSFGGDKVDG